jgi:hypothetical protein
MRGATTERQTSCTVAVELNRYGAMTLRSERGRTYQVVDSERPTITEELAELGVDSQVSVTLRQAHGRGNTWCVTDIGSDAVKRQAIRPLNQ